MKALAIACLGGLALSGCTATVVGEAGSGAIPQHTQPAFPQGAEGATLAAIDRIQRIDPSLGSVIAQQLALTPQRTVDVRRPLASH